MKRCSITLLGSIQVTLDDSPLKGLESAKVRALLAYLAVENARAHEREHLAGLFWPEMSETQARHSLSQSLYNLRLALGEASKTGDLSAQPESTESIILLVTPHTVQINPQRVCWLDVQEFERRISEVRRHAHRRLETCGYCARLLQEAEQLYQEDFLIGLSLCGCQAFEEWALVWREHLRCLLCQTLSDLSTYHEGRNDLHSALEVAERWAHVDPLSEPAQRRWMRVLALNGQRTQALARYAGFRRLLLSELDVEPGCETHQLYERILAEESPQASLLGMPGKLPIPLTPFIGRENELTELTAWLRNPRTRLVTLLGPGGSGKTRLALQAACALRYDFPDGLFLVSLSGLGSSEAFLPALASALGVIFQSNWGDPLEQLLGYLQGRRLLIILDSFEEVPAASQWITRLLQATPGLQLLVTSRTRLNLLAEHVFSLEGLNYPASSSLIAAPLELKGYSALQLFISAARQVRPDFSLTTQDQPHMVRICQLVDGMPLGLILAAGWLETCSLAEIVVEIERSLDFLASGWSDLPARQRSLRATLDHSWHLLTDDERQAFKKLSVFQSAFTRQAAEQAAEVSAAGLRRLVDKSMLQASQGSYRMHDLLRQYCEEKLSTDEPLANRVRHAYSAYYLERLAEYEARLKCAQRSVTLSEIDDEVNELQAAWKLACVQANVPLLSRSLEAFCLYYIMRMRFQEMKQALEKALGIQVTGSCTIDVFKVLNARLLVWQAGVLLDLGEHTAAKQLRQDACDLLDQLEAQCVDVRSIRAMYWQQMAEVQGELKTQFEYYQHGIQLYYELGDEWHQAGLLRYAGELAQHMGEYDLCMHYQQEALRINQQIGEPYYILASMIEMATINFILNRPDIAHQFMQKVITLNEIVSEPASRTNTNMHLGVLLSWCGRYPEAILTLEDTLQQLRSAGYRYGLVYSSYHLGRSCVLNGETVRAGALLQAVLPEAEQKGFLREAAGILIALGMAELAQRRQAQAEQYFQEGVQCYQRMQFASELGWALGGLALAQEAGGQAEAARVTLVEALRSIVQTPNMVGMITCLPAMVNFLSRRGHVEAALQMHRLAMLQPLVKNSPWYADVIGGEIERQWQALSAERRAAIDASACQHDPFTILPQVLDLLQPQEH